MSDARSGLPAENVGRRTGTLWQKRIWNFLRWAEHGLAAGGGLLIVYLTCFDLSYMSSSSMEPTLRSTEGNPDYILTQKVSMRFFDPDRWDVVTFRDRDGLQLIKRVVGFTGETVSLPDVGQLKINGRPVAIPERLSFLRYLPAGNLANGQSFAIERGWYVLGDQVRDSLDSRFEGCVPKERLVGRPWLRVWPPSRFGWIQ